MDLSRLKSIADAEVEGKRVLVRADLNVPLQNGKVTDRTRLERVAPTLRVLMDRKARVIVISHFGRPNGQKDPNLSLKAVADELAGVLKQSVAFGEDCIGGAARAAADALKPGEIAVLENLRFHAGEEKNDPQFAKDLASAGDIYVGEAFSAAHRAHASTEGVTHYLPSFAGPSMMAEIAALSAALDEPDPPTVAVIGGAKVSTKIPMLLHLLPKADKLIIGGGMANTFLQSMGVMVAQSLAEPEFHSNAREIQAEAKAQDCEIILPVDAVVARELKPGAATETVSVHKMPIDAMILDVGPQSVAKMRDVLADCRTMLWNGPLGAFEIEPFGAGTFALAKEAARLTRNGGLISVAGGGDTVAALNAAGVADQFSYVSTAGGAFLEWLEGRELPGVAALAR